MFLLYTASAFARLRSRGPPTFSNGVLSGDFSLFVLVLHIYNTSLYTQLPPPLPPIPLCHRRRTVVLPYFHTDFCLRALSFLVLSVYFDRNYVLSAFFAVYQAFVLDPAVLGISVFLLSSLSHGLRIAPVPAIYVRTRNISS